MIALIQRVTQASVAIEEQTIAKIGYGLLALIGIEKSDSQESVDALAKKLVSYRVFSDNEGKMNLDVIGAGGEILIVPQFTLVADTQKGRRPGFSQAASPQLAEPLFKNLERSLRLNGIDPSTGQFGADMQVALINDGPVTFWLQV